MKKVELHSTLTLRRNKDQYTIRHYLTSDHHEVAYSFSNNLLTEKTILHIHSIKVFKETADTVYVLNKKQDKAILDVLKKLIGESTSEYIFAEPLLKTYLVELIHLITKIHNSTLVVRSLF